MRPGFFAILIGFTLPGCESPSRETKRLAAEQDWNSFRGDFQFRIAQQQFEQDRMADARTTVQQAIQLNPTNAAFHRLLARCHVERRSFSSASEAVELAASLESGSAETLYVRGMIAESRSDYETAVEHYVAATEADSRNVDYGLAAAECMVTLDRLPEAKAFLDSRIDNSHRNEQLLLLRARVCVSLKEFDQAAADFNDATALVSTTRWAAEEHGFALLQLERYAEALSILGPMVEAGEDERAVAGGTAPPSAAAIRALAICHNGLGKSRNAQRILAQHLSENPDDSRAWWLLAETHAMLADWRAARRCLRRGEELAPDQPHWKSFHAYIAWRDRDLSKAVSLLQSVLAIHPDDPSAPTATMRSSLKILHSMIFLDWMDDMDNDYGDSPAPQRLVAAPFRAPDHSDRTIASGSQSSPKPNSSNPFD